MAPITDEIVHNLQDTIAKLEARVHQLESKLGGDGTPGKAAPGGQSVRMILMGPPGAGKYTLFNTNAMKSANCSIGKGTQAPKIQQKYCACHLVCLHTP